MKLEFQEYQVRKIVNVHRHVDAWFWDKYSAHPFVGCRSGCEFCYLRGGHYLGRRSPESFDTLIQVKVNAVELLRKELARLPKDVIACGDWQEPAETRYRLSRQMLQVVYELGFPLLVIERSPLLVQDVDLLGDINRQSWVGVVISLSSLDARLKQAFEPRSPGTKRRLQAMAALASHGILVGAGLMPLLPFIGDDEAHLEEVVGAIKDHGGSFVLAGGLSMAGVQAERSLQAARQLDAQLEAQWRRLYHWQSEQHPDHAPPRSYSGRLGLRVREIVTRNGLSDRMPRFVPTGALQMNKLIAERLFLKTYELEISQADEHRIWAYRKAAWMVDETPVSLAEVYESSGVSGLRSLPGIGSGMASELVSWLDNPAIIKE